MAPPVDSGFMLWGVAYVVLKWTVGLWVVRRVKASLTGGPSLASKS